MGRRFALASRLSGTNPSNVRECRGELRSVLGKAPRRLDTRISLMTLIKAFSETVGYGIGVISFFISAISVPKDIEPLPPAEAEVARQADRDMVSCTAPLTHRSSPGLSEQTELNSAVEHYRCRESAFGSDFSTKGAGTGVSQPWRGSTRYGLAADSRAVRGVAQPFGQSDGRAQSCDRLRDGSRPGSRARADRST